MFSGPVTEVKTDIFVTSFGPVSDVEMVGPVIACLCICCSCVCLFLKYNNLNKRVRKLVTGPWFAVYVSKRRLLWLCCERCS